ncbi:PIN domain-containing protein [Candidatus Palauibacter sp.]|uniref:PIN domain-containing protein n=1 Tax=Candidatus Palauibacter sp. TaxID=3101350 RepID=UPI003AF2299F
MGPSSSNSGRCAGRPRQTSTSPIERRSTTFWIARDRRRYERPDLRASRRDRPSRVIASPSCRVVLPGAGFLGLLATTSRRADARGNLMFDAQIAALCRENGISAILTNDRDFERFEGLKVRYLEAPEP